LVYLYCNFLLAIIQFLCASLGPRTLYASAMCVTYLLYELKRLIFFFDVLLTVHLSIFISVINQFDAQNIYFTVSLFHASICFEHMCSKHVEA